MSPDSVSMSFLSYIWVDLPNPKRLIKWFELNTGKTVFRAMVLDYKLWNYKLLWNGKCRSCTQWFMLLEALPATAVHRPPLFRGNSHCNVKKTTQFSIPWASSQKLHKFPKVSFCCLSQLFSPKYIYLTMHLNSISLTCNLWCYTKNIELLLTI